MKKIFEIPTITKMDFVLSDKQLCGFEITSGMVSDGGVVNSVQTTSQTSSATMK